MMYADDNKTVESDFLSFVIADDHAMIRMGFKMLLKDNFRVKTIYEAANGDELYSLVKKHCPDIIVMDIGMPETDAYAVLKNILSLIPESNIIVFSVNKEEIYGKSYLQAGARAYLHKDTAPIDIVKAIKCVLSGSIYIKRGMQNFYLGNSEEQFGGSPYSILTKKEVEVLGFLSKGEPLMKIAKVLNLSASTIASHKANILKKLKVDNTLDLKEMVNIHPI